MPADVFITALLLFPFFLTCMYFWDSSLPKQLSASIVDNQYVMNRVRCLEYTIRIVHLNLRISNDNTLSQQNGQSPPYSHRIWRGRQGCFRLLDLLGHKVSHALPRSFVPSVSRAQLYNLSCVMHSKVAFGGSEKFMGNTSGRYSASSFGVGVSANRRSQPREMNRDANFPACGDPRT